MSRRTYTRADQNALYFVQLRDAERRMLRDALEYHGWNVSAAARMLGISHTLVWRQGRMLGGVFAGEPRCEPFDYEERKEAIRAQRGYRNSAPQPRDDVRGEASDAADGETDCPDGPQAGDRDQAAVER